jgi:hypothetical protein
MATTTPEQIKMQITELQQLIQSAHPRMPILLKDIHKLLMADPDNVTLLDDESIGVIVSGLKKQTATEITAGALKKKTTLKNTTLADL